MNKKTSNQDYKRPEIQTAVLEQTEVICSSTTGAIDDFNVINGIW